MGKCTTTEVTRMDHDAQTISLHTEDSTVGEQSGDADSEPSKRSIDIGDILQPFGIRRSVRNGDGPDTRLLDYSVRVLPLIAGLLWGVFLVVKTVFS